MEKKKINIQQIEQGVFLVEFLFDVNPDKLKKLIEENLTLLEEK